MRRAGMLSPTSIRRAGLSVSAGVAGCRLTEALGAYFSQLGKVGGKRGGRQGATAAAHRRGAKWDRQEGGARSLAKRKRRSS
jgi:hypothetical protein